MKSKKERKRIRKEIEASDISPRATTADYPDYERQGPPEDVVRNLKMMSDAALKGD